MAARQAVQSNELLRRAYKYIARNTTLPSRVRHMAQLELNAFPNKSRPAYQFRRKAIAGEVPGVEKASW
ncbi:40S ribosomal protein mrp2, mitochondrial [Malassezia nana]|uniref:40S ribosomal protein mrp2, mitochondrial n=1 Tax=Malassezia nana TaxID=180528 RepID=A0AAF0EPG1_9BASI|nr:40S ribosomal protein mrp2, mitochondrial [Malassezia nana]